MTDVEVSLREWETVEPGSKGAPQGLAGFRFGSEEARRHAAALTKAGTLELRELHDGLHLRARSHVGRIQLDGLCVTVLPKIPGPALLSLFRYAYGLRQLKLIGSTKFATSGSLFQDLVVAQLRSEVRQLLERGMARSYVARNEELSSPRGRVDFARFVARGAQATTTLPCQHHVRATDHLLNRVVFAGLTLAKKMADDVELRAGLVRQEKALAELATPIALSSEVLSRARRNITRLVAPYESIITLIEILYFGSFLELEDEAGSRRLSGFLYDMNLFFQAMLARFLSEGLPRHRVETEYGLTGMMRYLPAHNPKGRTSPTPRPDYAVMYGSKVLALLDAKYRDLWGRSLPREMLYQLSVYALSQKRGSTAAILYPTTDGAARPSIIEIREPTGGTTAAYVALRPVHLDRMLEMIQATSQQGEARRQAWAAQLAGLTL